MLKRFIIFSTLLLILFFSTSMVFAITITVNAATPYAAADGRCSLVEAIENANADVQTHADCPAGVGADDIVLTRNISLSGATLFAMLGNNGLPSITSDITIEGNNFSITRASATTFRIFHVAAAGNLTLNQTTISNGLMTSGFDNGGAIFSDGTVTLADSIVQNSRVESIFPNGGGIYSTGILTVLNSLVRNNHADNNDAAQVFDNGGGIYSTGTLTIMNSTLSNNSAAEEGGGIYSFGDSTIINSTITANAAENGAGMLSGDIGGNSARIYNSSFFNNIASIAGGAILNGSDDVEIFGSTFSGNRVQGASALIGGAIYNTNGIMTITNSTIENNLALNSALGAGIASNQLSTTNVIGSIIRANRSAIGGGGFYTVLATTTVQDSLVSGNSAPNGGGFYAAASNVDSFFIIRTSVLNNSATTFGGGFYAEGDQTTSYFINSTVSGNTAPSGAGIMLNAGGQVDILHTTIANNVSTQFANSVGGANLFAGTATISSSIIANNRNRDCSATNMSVSGDYNITTGPSGGIPVDRWCSFIPIQPNDLTNTDPLLAPLAQNGNIGATHLLQAGSPAIGVIPANCPAGLNGIDQRGVPRSAGSCDVGAISDDAIILPIVSFTSASTLINDEATAPTQFVDILVDNTNGNLTAPGSLPLTIYLLMTGTAADGTDFTDNITIPTSYLFNAGNFPAPGTTATVQLSFDVIDDLIYEGNETIRLSLSLIGPGILGQQTTHILTIIDDETPPPVIAPTVEANPATAIEVFDPAISKIGFLLPGQVGVTGEQLEWIVTIFNTGNVVGNNVTITDTLVADLRIDRVGAPNANVNINAQTVTVTYATLNVGQSVQFSIFTTVLNGVIVNNTACVNADNQSAEECATGSLISQLPNTGQTPFWRTWVITLLGGLAFILIATRTRFLPA